MAAERPGKAFEKMVAAIEQAMGHQAGRTVEYDKRIRHLVTGKLRQFDVVVTQGDDHHKLVTVIECKDHGRAVDVELVEAFIAKVDGCDVNRGIIVSSNGFSEDARMVAAASKIATMTLQEAEAFDWIAMPEGNFVQHHQIIDHIQIQFDFDPPEPDIDALFARGARFVDENDVEFTNESLGRLLSPHVAWHDVPPGGDPVDFVFQDQKPQASLLEVDGERWRPRRIMMTATARVAVEVMDLALHTYATTERDVAVASADIQVGGTAFKLMLVRNADETTQVMLVPSPTPAAKE